MKPAGPFFVRGRPVTLWVRGFAPGAIGSHPCRACGIAAYSFDSKAGLIGSEADVTSACQLGPSTRGEATMPNHGTNMPLVRSLR